MDYVCLQYIFGQLIGEIHSYHPDMAVWLIKKPPAIRQVLNCSLGKCDDIYNRFFDGVTDGWKAYANDNGISENAYSVFYPDSGNAGDQLAKVVEAIDNGANVIILGGWNWDAKKAIGLAKRYPLVCFLSFEFKEDVLPANMVSLAFGP